MAQERQGELLDLLDSVRARIDEINKEKSDLVDALSGLLAAAKAELTDGKAPEFQRSQVRKKGGRRPGFRMSDEAKAKIAAAAKKRWAAWRKRKATKN
jgi:hypothetical protein